MKKLKLALLTLAFATLASTTAYAQEGWVNENDAWYYYDKDGEIVESSWETNADRTFYFYLNEDGKMVTSSLIEDDGYLYYVNSDGVQSRNKWRLLEDEEGDERWYYFDAKGRAVTNNKKLIDGKTYYFDEDGKMLYGWVSLGTDSNATMVEDWSIGDMYLGTNSTGWRYESAWLKEIEPTDDVSHFWFYFDSKGNKEVTSEKVQIDGIDYMFAEDGHMIENDFIVKEDGIYYALENGAVAKNRWIWLEEEDSWYYARKNGKLITDKVEKINGKYYKFAADGKMITGFVGSYTASNADLLDIKSTEFVDANYSYFTENGNRVTNDTIELELEDGLFVFGFDKNGMALNGEVDKKLYYNGILQRAVEYKYMFIDGYIVNASGKIMNGKTYKIDDITYVKNLNTGLYEKN